MLKYGLLIIVFLFSICASSAQSSCCEGYTEGFKRGYSYPNMNLSSLVVAPVCRCYSIIGNPSYNDGFSLGFADGQKKKAAEVIPSSNPNTNSGHTPYVYPEYVSPFPAEAYVKLQNQINAKLVDAQFLKSKGDELKAIALKNYETFGPYWNKGIKQWYYDYYQKWSKAEKDAQDKTGVSTNTYDLNSLFSFMNYRIKIWAEFVNDKNVAWAINVGKKSQITTNLLIDYIQKNGASFDNPLGVEINRVADLMNSWIKSDDWSMAPEIDLNRVGSISVVQRNSINFPIKSTEINFYDIKPKSLYQTIFYEDFNANIKNWDVGKDQTESSSIASGTYYLKNFSTTNWHWFTQKINSIKISVAAKSSYGSVKLYPTGNKPSNAGIVIGSATGEASTTAFLLFEFDINKKTFSLSHIEQGAWKTLIPESTSQKIIAESINNFSYYVEKNGIVLFANNYEIGRHEFTQENTFIRLGNTYGFYLSPKSEINIQEFSIIQEK
jgi:hypothetical protein